MSKNVKPAIKNLEFVIEPSKNILSKIKNRTILFLVLFPFSFANSTLINSVTTPKYKLPNENEIYAITETLNTDSSYILQHIGYFKNPKLHRLEMPTDGKPIQIMVSKKIPTQSRESIKEEIDFYNKVFTIINQNYKFEYVDGIKLKDNLTANTIVVYEQSAIYNMFNKTTIGNQLSISSHSLSNSNLSTNFNRIFIKNECFQSSYKTKEVFSHEFMHCLGLGDAYLVPEATNNSIMDGSDRLTHNDLKLLTALYIDDTSSENINKVSKQINDFAFSTNIVNIVHIDDDADFKQIKNELIARFPQDKSLVSATNFNFDIKKAYISDSRTVYTDKLGSINSIVFQSIDDLSSKNYVGTFCLNKNESANFSSSNIPTMKKSGYVIFNGYVLCKIGDKYIGLYYYEQDKVDYKLLDDYTEREFYSLTSLLNSAVNNYKQKNVYENVQNYIEDTISLSAIKEYMLENYDNNSSIFNKLGQNLEIVDMNSFSKDVSLSEVAKIGQNKDNVNFIFLNNNSFEKFNLINKNEYISVSKEQGCLTDNTNSCFFNDKVLFKSGNLYFEVQYSFDFLTNETSIVNIKTYKSSKYTKQDIQNAEKSNYDNYEVVWTMN